MIEAYKIGVSIVLANGVSPVLAIISKDLLGIRGPIAGITKQFESWNAKLLGVAGILGGSAIMGGLMEIAKHGDKLLDQQDKLLRAGLSHAQIANLTADAYTRITAAVPTATAADVLRATNELRAVTGSVTDAQGAVPNSLKLEAIVGNATGQNAEGAGYNVWRALEMKGVSMDEKLRDAMMGRMTASIIASGGRVTGQDWRNFAQQAGPAWQMANEHAMTGSIPYLMNEMGGERAGTGWNRMSNTIMGTRRWTHQQYDAWKDLGLIDQSKVLGGDSGGMLNFAPGGPITGGMANIGDLENFITKTVMPAFQSHNVTDPTDINARLAKMFPDSTAARVATRIYQQHANIDKDRSLNEAALPLSEAYKNFTTDNPKGVREAFDKQYESMLAAIGAPMMQAAIPVMRDVTSMFTAMGAFANSHPEAIKIIAEAIGAIGIALVGAGAATLIALGGVPAVITGLVAAAAGLVAVNWSSIVGMFDGIRNAIAAFVDQISALYNRLIGKGAALPQTQTSPDPYGNWSQAQKLAAGMQPVRFDPGPRQQPNMQASFSLNVDGHALAQSVVDHLESIYGMPSAAPAADGVHSPFGGDHQYTNT